MHVVAWPLTGISDRTDEIVAFLEQDEPDIACFWGTGVSDGDFPLVPFFELGYYTKLLGGGAPDGAAILSVEPPREVRRDADAFSARVAGMRVVVGAGAGLAAHVRGSTGRQERVLVVASTFEAPDFASLGSEPAPFFGRRDVQRRCAEVTPRDGGAFVARFTGLPNVEVPECQPWRGKP